MYGRTGESFTQNDHPAWASAGSPCPHLQDGQVTVPVPTCRWDSRLEDSRQLTVRTSPLCCPPWLPFACKVSPQASSTQDTLPAAPGPAPCPQTPLLPSRGGTTSSEMPWLAAQAAPGAAQQRLPVGLSLGADRASSCLQGSLIERAGRKTLLWKSHTVMALVLGLLTVTLSLQVRPHLHIRAVSCLHVLLHSRHHYYLPPHKPLFSRSRSILGLTIILTEVCSQPTCL